MKINLIAAVNGAPIGLSFGSEREITIGREIGSTIAPTAATVAGPEPDTAAKNMQNATVQMARPP